MKSEVSTVEVRVDDDPGRCTQNRIISVVYFTGCTQEEIYYDPFLIFFLREFGRFAKLCPSDDDAVSHRCL